MTNEERLQQSNAQEALKQKAKLQLQPDHTLILDEMKSHNKYAEIASFMSSFQVLQGFLSRQAEAVKPESDETQNLLTLVENAFQEVSLTLEGVHRALRDRSEPNTQTYVADFSNYVHTTVGTN